MLVVSTLGKIVNCPKLHKARITKQGFSHCSDHYKLKYGMVCGNKLKVSCNISKKTLIFNVNIFSILLEG
jgi:hypothetical protein